MIYIGLYRRRKVGKKVEIKNSKEVGASMAVGKRFCMQSGLSGWSDGTRVDGC